MQSSGQSSKENILMFEVPKVLVNTLQDKFGVDLSAKTPVDPLSRTP